ncbi:endonuclease/exonuclease/phosphatase family protein [Ideonella livida]|uniref:Endonuclease n=1 Tax=Ideonella livida TaxID=2707176 RepID=A0A7C9THP7_9BURK|nr:endonuclease/exonuclease/phosphatase family protein [Ideonella livida]NDY89844.1 endonuclease [Ideonella livida]
MRYEASGGSATTLSRLRVVSYNIHKGVRGVGPRKRLEIHNLGRAIHGLQADLVCLQEVRLFHAGDARRFDHTHLGWPDQGQADFLAPEGFESVYRTNAVTRQGEHGNALLSRLPVGQVRHHDVSDHRLEQRGLLHVQLQWDGRPLHVVVAHFGLIHGSRVRQARRLGDYLRREVPADEAVLVAGDFNDWSERLDQHLAAAGLLRAQASAGAARVLTFPSRLPLFGLDRMYLRGLRCVALQSPRGPAWARLSDHLPLVAELARA